MTVGWCGIIFISDMGILEQRIYLVFKCIHSEVAKMCLLVSLSLLFIHPPVACNNLRTTEQILIKFDIREFY
jgi:hypothetical protein